MDGSYETGFRWVGGTTWVITFIGAWIGCTAKYGFLLGFGLGWLPSLILASIVGFIAGLLWPLIVLALAGLAVMIAVQMN